MDGSVGHAEALDIFVENVAPRRRAIACMDAACIAHELCEVSGLAARCCARVEHAVSGLWIEHFARHKGAWVLNVAEPVENP